MCQCTRGKECNVGFMCPSFDSHAKFKHSRLQVGDLEGGESLPKAVTVNTSDIKKALSDAGLEKPKIREIMVLIMKTDSAILGGGE